MPITSSAKKALRSSAHKKQVNVKLANNIRRTTKDLKKAIESKGDISIALSQAQKSIDKACKKSLIHKNKANRKKSQLAKMIATKKSNA